MSEKIETITIRNCPHCPSIHTYQLFTKRTIVMFLADNENEEKAKTITCLFDCPSTGKPFQARLELRMPAKERITSIKVKPVAKAN